MKDKWANMETSADAVKEGGQAKTKMTVLEVMRTGCVPKRL